MGSGAGAGAAALAAAGFAAGFAAGLDAGWIGTGAPGSETAAGSPESISETP